MKRSNSAIHEVIISSDRLWEDGLTWQVKGLAEVWDLRGLGEGAAPAEPPA